jgi:hypothetical protein
VYVLKPLLHLWRLKFVYIILVYANSVPTSRGGNSASITMTDHLMLFREVIGFDCETRAKQVSSLCRQSVVFHNVTASGSNWLKLISSRKMLRVMAAAWIGL